MDWAGEIWLLSDTKLIAMEATKDPWPYSQDGDPVKKDYPSVSEYSLPEKQKVPKTPKGCPYKRRSHKLEVTLLEKYESPAKNFHRKELCKVFENHTHCSIRLFDAVWPCLS